MSVWHSLGETNAAQKREDEDYENKRKSRKSRVGKGREEEKAAASVWHESRLRRQSLH